MTNLPTRSRWAAIGAAVAVTLGAGGIGITHATTDSGDGPVSAFFPIEPCRLADTRPAPNTVGPRTSPLGPGETETFAGWNAVGNCDLPSGTSGLSMNVTAVGATQQTNLRFFPADGDVPTAANLNPTPGSPPTPNAVNVALDDDGEFSVFNAFGSVAVVIDVVGYYDDHTHDDRYYTRAQSDSRFLTDAEVQDAIDERVPSSGQLNVWWHEFTSNRAEDDMVRNDSSNNFGATFIPGSLGSAELEAPVHLPDGAVITAATAYLLDNSATANNRLEASLRCRPIPDGTATFGSYTSDVTLWIASSSNTATDTFEPFTMNPFGGQPDEVVVDHTACAYVIKVRSNSNASTWNTEGTNMRVMGVTIDYRLAP